MEQRFAVAAETIRWEADEECFNGQIRLALSEPLPTLTHKEINRVSYASSCDVTGSTMHHIWSTQMEPDSNQACKSNYKFTKNMDDSIIY